MKSQVTSLAATNADAFVLGGALLACPAALNAAQRRGLAPDHLHVGHVRVEAAVHASAATNANGVFSVTPLLDPADPANASNPAMKLYKAQVKKYQPKADAADGIVAYGWSTGGAAREDPASASPALDRARR